MIQEVNWGYGFKVEQNSSSRAHALGKTLILVIQDVQDCTHHRTEPMFSLFLYVDVTVVVEVVAS